MAIPDFQEIMLPLLRFLGDGRERTIRELINYLSQQYELSEQERKELLPSGRQAIIDNRTGWARTYLKKAGLLDIPRRGYAIITDEGKKVLSQNPTRIDIQFLDRFPAFTEFRTIRANTDADTTTRPLATPAPVGTPQEDLEYAYQRITDSLESDLLARIKECSPEFFERVVIDLIVKMGYGGSAKEAGEHLGRTGDGGVDGMIKQDRLGLDVIYLQAKRWDKGSVGRPEVQKFAGALQERHATKGIFITTSYFTADALSCVKNLQIKVILIDGARLAPLLIEHGIGVTTKQTFKLKELDTDYFQE